MSCQDIGPLLETFADGELSVAQTIEVETHLDRCEQCAARVALMQALKASTRRVVAADAPVSRAFLERVSQALEEEERHQELQSVQEGQPMLRRWRSLWPALAVAAVIVLYFGARADRDALQVMQRSHVSAGVAPMTMEGALDRLIDYHSSPPEPQVTEANQLTTFEPNVGVRIRAPELAAHGAHWEGGSLVPIVNQQAAYLRYRMPGHRVTVYVFDPRKVPVSDRLERREIDDASIYVGEWRGYSIAARENQGVGYALAADLDDQAVTRLIRSIH